MSKNHDTTKERSSEQDILTKADEKHATVEFSVGSLDNEDKYITVKIDADSSEVPYFLGRIQGAGYKIINIRFENNQVTFKKEKQT